MNIDTKVLQNPQVLEHPSMPIEGTTISLPNGTSLLVTNYNEVWIVQDGVLLPLSDPAAEALINRTHRKIMRYLPFTVLASTAVACFFIVTVWALDTYPTVQEQVLGIHTLLGIVFVRLIGMLFVLLVLYIALNILFATKQTKKPVHYDCSVKDGIALIINRSEDDSTISERLDIARSLMHIEQGSVRAVLFFRFQDPTAYFWNAFAPDRMPSFDRCEGSRKWELPTKYQGRVFASESWDEYQEYITTVEPLIRDQWLRARHQAATNPMKADNNLQTILKTAMLILGLICSTAATAQKSRQVAEYLGAERYTAIPGPVGTVRYAFERAVLQRVGDGKFSHQKLLPDSPAYTDQSNAGALLDITIQGKTIDPAPKPSTTQQVAEQPQPLFDGPVDPVRPRGAIQNNDNSNALAMIPDSSTLAANTNKIKQDFEKISIKIKKALGQAWDLVMYFFSSLLVLLMGALGFFRYIAQTAANESLVSIKGKTIVGGWIVRGQQNAAGLTLILAWIIIGAFLIDAFIFIVHMEWSLWLTAIIWGITLGCANKITDWLVPNIRVSSRNYP